MWVIAISLFTGIPKVTPYLQQFYTKYDKHKVIKVWLYFNDRNVDTEIVQLKNMGCDFVYYSGCLNAAVFRMPIGKLPEVSSFSKVKLIDKVKLLVAPLPEVELPLKSLPYGASYRQLAQLNIPKLHELGYTGSGVKIGILDTGFDWIHIVSDEQIIATRDFIWGDDNVMYQPDEFMLNIGDTTVFMQDIWLREQLRHGTGMLSLIAGTFTDKLIGAAFGASFALAKTELVYNPFLGNYMDIVTEEDWWVRGAEWLACSVGVDIISNSLGYKYFWDPIDQQLKSYSYTQMDGTTCPISRVASILADSFGVLLVTAMGNVAPFSSERPDTCIVSPADANYVLAVGGVDTVGGWAWDPEAHQGAAIGPRGDSMRVDTIAFKPEVVAPYYAYYMKSDGSSLQPVYGAGTSVATALMAGLAALVLEAHPSWRDDPKKLRYVIMHTASMAEQPNDTMGFGIPDAYEAVHYEPPEVTPTPLTRDRLLPPYPNPLRLSETTSLQVPMLILHPSYAILRIYTLSGRLICERYLDRVSIGYKVVTFTLSDDLPSGIYICTLTTGFARDRLKFTIIK